VLPVARTRSNWRRKSLERGPPAIIRARHSRTAKSSAIGSRRNPYMGLVGGAAQAGFSPIPNFANRASHAATAWSWV
jgi:hypothetical protein